MKFVSKDEVIELISSEPLGYTTEQEHVKLENFADRLCAAIALLKTISLEPTTNTTKI